jgi:GNAT superfamily N-acetyltransferase
VAGKHSTGEWTTRPLTKSDYDYIVGVIDRWWGGPTSTLAHPIFFYELGELARVAEHEGKPVGFLFGFVAPARQVGYVHLVGIAPEFRRRGVASALYRAFEAECRAAGCLRMKAVTTLGNEGSVRFHHATGWKSEDVADYAGPGRTRLVFTRKLDDPSSSGRRSRAPTEAKAAASRTKARPDGPPTTERSGRGASKR